ncbi:MAG: glycosyltransferase family A protein [Terrimesophilobacter sp.]
MTAVPLVDLVVAIHDPTRPLERGLRAILNQGMELGSELRVSVVCHNTSVESVRGRLSAETSESVRFLELQDGVHSPAGPFNVGLDQATARYFSIMGSDDVLEQGAVKAWFDRAERDSLAAVIADIRLEGGRTVRTPPHRPLLRRALHPVKDRLAYRSAPLGLVRREVLERLGLRFTDGLATGEDQDLCLKLWFAGERIGFARGEPRYLVGNGAAQRVTLVRRPIAEDLRAPELIIDGEWFLGRSLTERRSIAAKILRIHVFAAAELRVGEGWADGEREKIAGFLGGLRVGAEGFERPFSFADRRLADALADAGSPTARLAELTVARRRFGRPSTLLTRDIRGLLAVEGPLRFMAASTLF